MAHGKQSTRLRSLASLARAVARSGPLLRLLEDAAEETRSALDAATVSVSRLEEDGSVVRTLLNVGQLGPTEERWPENEVYCIAEFANLRGVTDDNLAWTIHREDPGADPREVELLHELGKESAVGSPLIVDGVLWGEFYATRCPGEPPYGHDDMSYLEAVSAIIAGAVSRAQREESLRELAYHDALTGLLNRRALDERAAACFAVPDGTSRPVTVVVADINGLKRVNDTLGHLAGDQLLKSVAAAMSHRFARFPGSLVARVGGDEFTALVPGHPVDAVVAAADELCAVTWGTANVSCGAATAVLRSDGLRRPSDLFAAADRAQYVAKRGGLRRTVLAEDVDACETMGT